MYRSNDVAICWIVRNLNSHWTLQEYHAFWYNGFSGLGLEDNRTLLISDPTTRGTPAGVDFYEMRRRNIASVDVPYDFDYSPMGE
jgi:hypothetical protein